MIPRRHFGATGAAHSEIGLGCASYWGLRQYSERKALRVVHEAIDLGVTVFDTGASYSNGHAEPRLGRALQGRSTSGLLISTKAGTFIRNGRLVKDFSGAAVRSSVESSLRQLRLEQLPLLYLHGCPADQLNDDLRESLLRLKDASLVRWVGLNSFDESALRAVAGDPLFDAVMLDYNILRPQRTALISDLSGAGKAVIAGASLARAAYQISPLRMRRVSDVWYWLRARTTSREDLKESGRFRFLREVPGWSAAQLALRFVLNNQNISCAMFSTTQVPHLRENAAVSSRQFDSDVAAKIAQALK